MNSSKATNTVADTTGALHILVLDDEQPILSALTRLLVARGYECTTASTGEDLLEIIDSAQHTNITYSLAILDIKIPNGMGAFETAKKMRQSGYTIPVITMSGYSIPEVYNDNAEGCGISGHLQKPFQAEELVQQIERLCPPATPG